MACYLHKMRNGGIMRIRGKLGPHCTDCCDVSTILCDYPVGKNKTCNRKVCEEHAHEIAPDLHYCDAHFKEWQEFKNSGGVKKELENVVPYKKS